LYDYATRVEYLGIGIWGNKLGAPDWTAEELREAFLAVLDNSSRAQKIRKSAEELGSNFDGRSGSACAARELASLAAI
jgi:UDP:flavonoid glycosyltransferase YjiC (YdhE family)